MLNMQCLLDLTRIAWVDLMLPSMAPSTDLNTTIEIRRSLERT